MAERPPSQIPVAVNRRSSIILQNSTNSINTSQSSTLGVNGGGRVTPVNGQRAGSPLGYSKPSASGKTTPNNGPGGGGRRLSLLSAGGGSRKTSFSGDSGGDDPTHLKAQIALLQSSLQASHQRILDLTAGLNLHPSSAVSSPGGPWTPLNYGLLELPSSDGLSPGQGIIEEDETVDRGDDVSPAKSAPEAGETLEKPRLPHSSSSYDLRSRAVTPGKSPLPEHRLGLSRIPHSTVQHALSLHPSSPSSPSGSPNPQRNTTSIPRPPSPYSPNGNSNHLGLGPPPTTNGRLSPAPNISPGTMIRRSSGFTGGSAASTKVIDGLQTELMNTRGHLERVKQEVRSRQRVIESLTRQSEDLRETRDRMRVECEGLNNIIARKERMLQEVLERARTAEASLASHLSTKKALEQSTKKSLHQMAAQLSDAQAAHAKAESEATSLRESVRSLRDVWAREVKAVREEWKRGEERARAERAEAAERHLGLVKLVQAQSAERANILTLAQTSTQQSQDARTAFEAEIAGLREKVDASERESTEARNVAQGLAEELVRLRRMMREPKRDTLEEAASLGGQVAA